jgi:hypothetical protein
MLVLSKGPNRVGVSFPHLRTKTDPVFETLCFLVIQNSGRWTKSSNPVVLGVIHHRQNPLKPTFMLISLKDRRDEHFWTKRTLYNVKSYNFECHTWSRQIRQSQCFVSTYYLRAEIANANNSIYLTCQKIWIHMQACVLRMQRIYLSVNRILTRVEPSRV